ACSSSSTTWISFGRRVPAWWSSSTDRYCCPGRLTTSCVTPGWRRCTSALMRRSSGRKPRSPMAEPILEVRNLRAGYGRGRDVLRDVELTVGAGEFVSVLGPNGAGKSTLMNTLAGRLPVTAGTIRFAGEDITHLRPGDRVDRGL